MLSWLSRPFRTRETRLVLFGMAAFLLLLLLFFFVVIRFYQEQTRASFMLEKRAMIEQITTQAEATVNLAQMLVEQRYQYIAGEIRLRALYDNAIKRQLSQLRGVIADHATDGGQLTQLPRKLAKYAPDEHAGSLWIIDFSSQQPLMIHHSLHPDWHLQSVTQYINNPLNIEALRSAVQGRYLTNPFHDFNTLPTLSFAFVLPEQQWVIGITLAFPEVQQRAQESILRALLELTQRQQELRFWIQDRFLPVPNIVAESSYDPKQAPQLANLQIPRSLLARLVKSTQQHAQARMEFRYPQAQQFMPAVAFGRAFTPHWILGAAQPLSEVEEIYRQKWQAFTHQLYILLTPVLLILVLIIITTGGFAWRTINRLHQTLERAQREAEMAQRAKTRFLTTMSHEIRTPMNGVLGMAEILLDTELTEKQRHLVETMRNSGKTLIGTVNDLLDFSKAEAGKVVLSITEVDLFDVVDDVVELFTVQAQRKGVGIHTYIPEQLPDGLQGDPVRLRQIFSNLMGNAIKFTDHGEITVRLAILRQDEQKLRLQAEIHDTGVGMPPDVLKNLFRGYNRDTLSTHTSTGLGLSISKQLVEMMGGEIGVTSIRGQGTKFIFNLRLKIEKTRQRANGAKIKLADYSVLVVDDNATNREILQHHLGAWGMRNEAVDNAHQALSVLRNAVKRNQAFDVVLLDHNLPDIDGLALARQIKSEHAIAETRLVMLSSASEVNHQEISQAGILYSFHKPVHQSKLHKCMMNVLQKTTTPKTTLMVQEKTQPAPSPAQLPPLNASLLLVEDNQINQQVATIMLQSFGCSVEVAANGRLALEALARKSFDVILMDCQMPEMNGFETTRVIRAQEQSGQLSSQHVPVIAVTANTTPEDQKQCYNAGMDDFLSKPFNKEQLSSMLQKWLGMKSKSSKRSPST